MGDHAASRSRAPATVETAPATAAVTKEAAPAVAPATAPTASPDVLVVTVRGFQGGSGQAAFALFDDSDTYASSSRPFRAAFVPIASGESTWRLEGVPPGRYAVKAYHDTNANQRLDTGAFGIPKEPYGFSNDARGRRGPPLWSAASFDVGGGETNITFRVGR